MISVCPNNVDNGMDGQKAYVTESVSTKYKIECDGILYGVFLMIVFDFEFTSSFCLLSVRGRVRRARAHVSKNTIFVSTSFTYVVIGSRTDVTRRLKNLQVLTH